VRSVNARVVQAVVSSVVMHSGQYRQVHMPEEGEAPGRTMSYAGLLVVMSVSVVAVLKRSVHRDVLYRFFHYPKWIV
jgi:hypothetical protein